VVEIDAVSLLWLRETSEHRDSSICECRCVDLLAETRSTIFTRGAA